ncbi:MAG: HipA domain-containing protein [Parachlamydiaceae bacterium]|nr:HipA domain-containing protein [Parachlamydiaceae bacterium]
MATEDTWYGLHKNCFKEWFGVEEASKFLDLVVRSQSQAPTENYMANISFFNGAYRKYSARLKDSSFILKVQQNEYPELPATEYLCNQIYDCLNITIPSYYLVRFPEEQFCFVTKNFMSSLAASDLVHIYHFVKNGRNHDCESLVSIIGEQTGRRTEQERFVYLTLADSLIGNHDRHGRNLGFIQSAKGMNLAPFYDNPTALALEEHAMLGADLQPRGSIFTKETDKPTMKDYVHEWNRLGYGEVVDRFRKQYSLAGLQRLIEKSNISEKRQKAILRLISKRGEELCEI